MCYPQSSRPKIVAIIQARLTSKRLPRKVLMDICGKTMLERVIEQVKKAKLVSQVVVATCHDLEIKIDIPVYYGDEFDVVKRYYNCSKSYNADIIVRITADCPLIDPEIIDYAIRYFKKHSFPYVYFAPVDGLDVEVFSFKMLEETNRLALSKEDREHVTPYMKRKTKISVDGNEDLERVREIWNGQIKLSWWSAALARLGRPFFHYS